MKITETSKLLQTKRFDGQDPGTTINAEAVGEEKAAQHAAPEPKEPEVKIEVEVQTVSLGENHILTKEIKTEILEVVSSGSGSSENGESSDTGESTDTDATPAPISVDGGDLDTKNLKIGIVEVTKLESLEVIETEVVG